MNRRLILACLVFGSLFLLLGTGAFANVLVDENFDGANGAFFDNGYNFEEMGLTTATQARIDSLKGINCEWQTTDSSLTKAVISNTGTVVTEAYFAGTKSLKLGSTGQSVKMAFNGDLNPYWMACYNSFYQFAVRTNAASLNLPVGTRIGHWKISYSTNGTDKTAETSVQLDIKVKSASTISLYYGAQELGTIGTGSGSWTVVSIVNHPGPNSAYNYRWSAYDWIHGNPLLKGPRGDYTGDNTLPMEQFDDATEVGLLVFINSNIATRIITPTEIGAGFAADGVQTNSTVVGWEIASENGGVLYVDNLFHSGDTPEGVGTAWTQNIAARILTFTGAEMTEPVIKEAGASNWLLY